MYDILFTVNTQQSSRQDTTMQLGYIWLHVSAVTGHLQTNYEQYYGTVKIVLYLHIVLSWPEVDRLRPKYVAKCNLIVLMRLV